MTFHDPEATTRQQSGEAPVSPQRRSADVQFAPGTVIAGRYRVASILGSGGMGEVYRADDTKLDQPVALKFLPARLARDPVLLGHLHDEVRLGRQVTHPNVCRLYDIVEWEGAHFVSMEYVDGEDLSRLLRRIGRLADDKAVDLARGIAAGLLAAHGKGILHRDLKPANVMLDSRGDARIMDFGLALGSGDDDGTISGTPAYMAPEQLSGAPATVQSDLYALGLVMYELFTGKRVHHARTMPERLREIDSEITTPSNWVRDLDPAVERIILRCLASDPAQRPRSAREVIDALPGGDPLAAALAAGETPSPRIVAAAGTEGSLAPWQAWTMLGAVVLLLGLIAAVGIPQALTRYTSLDLSPEVLRQRAADILRTLQVPVRGTPIRQVVSNDTFLAWLGERKEPRRWEALRNGPGAFRYRLEYGPTPAISRLMPFFANAPGWTTIEVDPRGRLFHLLSAPAGPVAPKALDWRPLLDAAGLNAAALHPVAPRDAPTASFDVQAAWTGSYPADRTPIRVEAAAWHGTPVYFQVRGPWENAVEAVERARFGSHGLDVFALIMTFVVGGIALFLAWRNLRLRRGDRPAAIRLASAVFVLLSIRSVLNEAANAGIGGLPGNLLALLGNAAVTALSLFVLYIALEPYARRRWPELLIGWARLVGGRPRDPLVGRHVLIGLIGGAVHALIVRFEEPAGPLPLGFRALTVTGALGEVAGYVATGIENGCTLLILLVLFTMVLRRRGLATAALFAISMLFYFLALGHRPELIPAFAVVAAVQTLLTVRWGLLAISAAQAAFFLLLQLPIAPGAAWVTPVTLIPLLVLLAVAVWTFVTSLGGRSPFSASMLDG